jgi:hypothetical protein
VPSPTECFEEVVDTDCVKSCNSNATASEEAVSKGTATGIDLATCIAGCKQNVSCRGSTVPVSSNEEMMKKLEEIHAEVTQTRSAVQTIIDMLTAITNMFKALFARFMPASTNTTTNTTE